MTRNLGPPTAGWLGTALVGAPVRVIAVIAGLASLALVGASAIKCWWLPHNPLVC